MAREYTIEPDGSIYSREVGPKALILNPTQLTQKLLKTEDITIPIGVIDSVGGDTTYMEVSTKQKTVVITTPILKVRYPWMIDGDLMKPIRMDRGSLLKWMTKNPAPPVMEINAPAGGFWAHYYHYHSDAGHTYAIVAVLPAGRAMQTYRPPVDNVREDGQACTGRGEVSRGGWISQLRSYMELFYNNVANTDYMNNAADTIRFKKVEGKWIHVPFEADQYTRWQVVSSPYSQAVIRITGIQSTEVR